MIYAIQGAIGSNHHMVARTLSPDISDNEILCATTFEDVCVAVKHGSAEVGIMAIENSIAGSIHANYALLSQYDLTVVGEVILPIHHCLIGLPGANLDAIGVAYSHEMALRQCEVFLYGHQIEGREYFDTAAAAQLILEKNDRSLAAIAPKPVVALFGLQLLAENIETQHDTQTRFLLLSAHSTDTSERGPWKVMLEYTLAHKPGSLATVLDVFKRFECNLTKIESIPIAETPWECRFFMDCTFDGSRNSVREILREARRHMRSLRVHGIFPRGERISL